MMQKIPRRTLLTVGAAAAGGAVVGAGAMAAILKTPAVDPGRVSAKPRVTFESWRASRQPPYYIAHRGAADVAPEHTLPGYQTALEWGAEAIEISVVRSSDNEIFCLHDLSLDRTTNATGAAALKSGSAMAEARVRVPRLGPRWAGSNMPRLPKLQEVLDVLGGHAVLCIEAKDDSAYPAMVKIIETAGLRDTVMIKLPGTAVDRMKVAKGAEYPIFAYFGNPSEVSTKGIVRLGKQLSPETDAMILPSRTTKGSFSTDLIRKAVDTGIPVWLAPVHRRHEVKSFGRLGVEGFVSPDLGYLTRAEPVQRVDKWESGGLATGELTLEPTVEAYGLHWEEEGAIGLDLRNRPAFLMLGEFCPIETLSYRISFDAAFDPLPTDTWQHLSIAFGHADDRYYQHRLGNANGFHAQLRADGSMNLYAHVEGDPNGQPLTPTRATPPLKAGLWSRLTLDVTPEVIRWSRDDGGFVEARDARFRGGYFHIGRSGTDGKLKIRNLSVS